MTEVRQRQIVWWSIIVFCIGFWALTAEVVLGQEAQFGVQFTHGGESDLAGFHLFWGETSGTYALGYDMPIADYLAPPEVMTIPVGLAPGDYYFVVTAYDTSGNESVYSEESDVFHVGDTTPPGACSAPILKRIPVD